MECKTVFNFETSHDTVNKTMTHTIKPFTVMVDWANMTIKTMKGSEVIELLSFKEESFTIAKYEKLLLTVEENANKLNEFHND